MLLNKKYFMKKVNPIYLWCRRGSASCVFKKCGGITGAVCGISVLFCSDIIFFTMSPVIFLSNSEAFLPIKHSSGDVLSFFLISILYHVGVGVLAGLIGYILWKLYKYLKFLNKKNIIKINI